MSVDYNSHHSTQRTKRGFLHQEKYFVDATGLAYFSDAIGHTSPSGHVARRRPQLTLFAKIVLTRKKIDKTTRND